MTTALPTSGDTRRRHKEKPTRSGERKIVVTTATPASTPPKSTHAPPTSVQQTPPPQQPKSASATSNKESVGGKTRRATSTTPGKLKGLLTKRGVVSTTQSGATATTERKSVATTAIKDPAVLSGKSRSSGPVARPKTKIVVRHLPPTLEESSFRETIDSLLATSDTLVEYARYVRGKISRNGRVSYSRAYYAFKSTDRLLDFYRVLDGYVFVDAKGMSFRAIVEYAPFQGVPVRARRENPKENTIESDEAYQMFVRSFHEKLTDKPDTVASNTADTPISVPELTPLIEYLVKSKGKLAAKPKKKPKRNPSSKPPVVGGGAVAATRPSHDKSKRPTPKPRARRKKS